MTVLAIETSTAACSVALATREGILERYEIAPRRHTERVLPMAESLLAEAEIDRGALTAVAFGRGPGGFTGLRVVAAMAQGIAFGGNLPVVPISTLAVLAQGAAGSPGSRLIAAMDARLGEVYWGPFIVDAAGLVVPEGGECLRLPDAVPVPAEGAWFGVGDAWEAHGAVLRRRVGSRLTGFDAERLPRAADLARLALRSLAQGGGRPAIEAVPVYLRDSVATPPAPRGLALKSTHEQGETDD